MSKKTNAKVSKKADRVRWHFNDRLVRRFGIKATPQIVKSIIQQIQNNESEFIKRQSRAITLHKVKVQSGDKEVPVLIVYNSVLKMPVTALFNEGQGASWLYE